MADADAQVRHDEGLQEHRPRRGTGPDLAGGQYNNSYNQGWGAKPFFCGSGSDIFIIFQAAPVSFYIGKKLDKVGIIIKKCVSY